MKKYILRYNHKTYRYNGHNTSAVLEKFQNRQVFGNPIICNVSLKMCDADTRGEIWALYQADGKPLMIEARSASSR